MEDIGNWRHMCIDMQYRFEEATPWQVEWMENVLPAVGKVTGHLAEGTIFARFIPPEKPDDMPKSLAL